MTACADPQAPSAPTPAPPGPNLVLVGPGTVSKVTATDRVACALRTDTSIACWGGYEWGLASPPPGTYTDVDLGDEHGCAVKTNGEVACWGQNNHNQANPAPGTFVAVKAGFATTCAKSANQILTCWGNDFWHVVSEAPAVSILDYEIGTYAGCAILPSNAVTCWGDDGNTGIPSGTPVGSFANVAVGLSQACAVSTSNALTCWGLSSSPVANPPAGTYTDVAVADQVACAVRTDATLVCWGDNYQGAASPPAGTFTSVSTGGILGYSSCAVSTAQGVICWGDLSLGSFEPKNTFAVFSAGLRGNACGLATNGSIDCFKRIRYANVDLPPPGTFSDLSVGTDRACAVQANGQLVCWGDMVLPPFTAPSGSFQKIAVGEDHACGIETAGTLTCFGDLSFPAPPGGQFMTIESGADQSCAIGSSQQLACFGSNPALAITPVSQAKDVGVGYQAACAVDLGGVLSCWGDDTYGQVSQVPSGTFSRVSVGFSHSCAVRSNGTVTCWGRNNFGETAAPAGSYQDVSAGFNHSCGLEPDSSIRCWGLVTIDQSTPPTTNRAPIASVGGPYAGTEGTAVAFDGSGSSDPDNQPVTYDWDFGDGSPHGTGPTANHTYLDNGSYTVTLTVSDGVLSTAASTTVQVTNIAPTATYQAPASVNQGTQFALALVSATDASPTDLAAGLRYAFDCGTGTLGSASGAASATCSQVVVGSYTTRGQVLDKDNGATTYSRVVQVRNVAPTVTITNHGTSFTINVGQSFTVTGSFTDPGTQDNPWTARMTWGPNQFLSLGTVTPGGTISGTRVFTVPGKYEIGLEVRDKFGARGRRAVALTVR
ncbi:MAG: PKD domain-containing protein [Gemmatimonadales bacterium]